MTAQQKRQALTMLSQDARCTPEMIAAATGLSAEVIAQAIAGWEKEGVIVRYQAVIDWARADEDMVEAIIHVGITPQSEKGFDAIAARLYRFPEVRSVYLVSGEYDLMVFVQGHSVKEVGLFVSEKLSTIVNVQKMNTHFALKRYKIDGVVIHPDDSDHRLVISP